MLQLGNDGSVPAAGLEDPGTFATHTHTPIPRGVPCGRVSCRLLPAPMHIRQSKASGSCILHKNRKLAKPQNLNVTKKGEVSSKHTAPKPKPLLHGASKRAVSPAVRSDLSRCLSFTCLSNMSTRSND